MESGSAHILFGDDLSTGTKTQSSRLKTTSLPDAGFLTTATMVCNTYIEEMSLTQSEYTKTGNDFVYKILATETTIRANLVTFSA